MGKLNFYEPKSDELKKMMEQLAKTNVARVKGKTALDFGRNKLIRKLRENDCIFIGYDNRKRISIMNVAPHVKIKKKDTRYYFEFLLLM